jgi:uncharacterized Ntn-hydrolase superfamily protein
LHYKRNEKLTNTYSIVARDTNTGYMGVGVQSHWFSVGTVVSFGEAGVGVVATQSLVNISYGPRGLDLLKEGKTPQEAIDILLQDDDGRDYRQVAILDSKGSVSTHTGKKCIKEAGHINGKGFSVQANMMLSSKVWSAMASAFSENSDLKLPERILECLKAAEAEGGDIRGRQSAALLIVDGERTAKKWEDPMIDLRVDDHQNPLVELSRLLKVYRAYEHMNKGDLAIEKNDMDIALVEYSRAQEMFPENLEMKFWTAVSLVNNNRVSDSKPLFKEIFQKENKWRLLLERLPTSDLLKIEKEELEQILSL